MSASLDPDIILEYTSGRTVAQELRVIKRAVARILRRPLDSERCDGLIACEEIITAAIKEYSGGACAKEENSEAEEG